MKVCSVCNEIVSEKQGCGRSNCPAQNGTAATPNPRAEPRLTGKADRAVAVGVDIVSGTGVTGTRQVLLAIVAAAFLGGAGFFVFSSAYNSSNTWGYGTTALKWFSHVSERQPSNAFSKKGTRALPHGYKPIPKEGWYAGMGLTPPKFRRQEK